MVYLHKAYSDSESFLETVDKHEHGNQLMPRTGIVSYGEQDPSYVPDALGPPNPDPSSTPMITYAWSDRIGLPMWLPLILFALYPGLVLARKHPRWGMYGFDLRIRSTTGRMLVTTVVGTILVTCGYIPISFLGFYLPQDVDGTSMWVVVPVFAIVSYSPGIYATLWLFWRLTPGNHGGLLWRRRQRMLRERGLCLTCTYDLTGNESGVCPECGTEIEQP